jgi:hypothetical protein
MQDKGVQMADRGGVVRETTRESALEPEIHLIPRPQDDLAPRVISAAPPFQPQVVAGMRKG